MFQILTICAVLISAASAQTPSGNETIPTNGTEMRNLTNSTLWGRYDYWNNLIKNLYNLKFLILN